MKEDVFDRLMHLPVLKVFEPFYKKHKEVLMYLLFGGLAFFLNLFLFALFTEWMRINALLANCFCWIICVLFQFFTNRAWVFDVAVGTWVDFWRQMGSFFVGRLFTLVVEEIILAVFITLFGLDAMFVKLAAQVVVIILNYIISKSIVFKKHYE